MIGEALNMEREEALSIFGWLSTILIFSKIIGGIFGDLLIGNRKSIIIGGIMQSIGAFSLCIPSTFGLYCGLLLMVLGSGFFSPNLISTFGKLYLHKTKLLDSGFTILNLAINLGTFLGVLSIGYLGERYGYNIGFIISGLLMLFSIVPLLFFKEIKLNEVNKFSTSNNVFKILIGFFTIGIFWGIYGISNIRIFDLQLQFSEISTLEIPKYLWQSINEIFIIPISIVLIIFWTYFYSSQSYKLMLGFIFGILSLSILFLIPEIPSDQHTLIYLGSLFLLGISEIFIAPIIHSILTKYSNPKYLAILISIAFIPTRIFSMIFGFFKDRLYDHPILGLKLSIVVMIVFGIGLIGYVWWNRKKGLHQNE